MAAPGKGLLAILTAGKGKPMGGDSPDDEPDAGSKGDSVGERAAQDMIDAIKSGDAAGVYDACERMMMAHSDEMDSGEKMDE